MANIKRLIRDLYHLEEQICGLESIRQTTRTLIQEFFDKKNIAELEVEPEGLSEDVTLVAKKTERVMIEYFADKLKANLSKAIYNEVTNKNYFITDINGLISLLKKAGIKPRDFKKYLNVEAKVNKDALKQLYAVGDIKKEDLNGCYNAKIVKSISIKPKKG